jgi:very-short-patch-repair endonuclease
MEDHSSEALQNARRLRREMSLPEVLLWRQLRLRPLGLKFRRQHPIGNYVADFFCASARAVIEIDGIAHDMGDRADRDQARDTRLLQHGFVVLRIPASEVLKDCVAVADSLARACQAVPPPSAADAAATSPNGGGCKW